jgi:hypothetical protein
LTTSQSLSGAPIGRSSTSRIPLANVADGIGQRSNTCLRESD